MNANSVRVWVWVVVDVGCIECGVETQVLGVFDSQESAESVATLRRKEFPGFRDGGQHVVDVIRSVFHTVTPEELTAVLKAWKPNG